jgi:hypothetical protein
VSLDVCSTPTSHPLDLQRGLSLLFERETYVLQLLKGLARWMSLVLSSCKLTICKNHKTSLTVKKNVNCTFNGHKLVQLKTHTRTHARMHAGMHTLTQARRHARRHARTHTHRHTHPPPTHTHTHTIT